MNSKARKAAEALTCCGIPAARGVACPLCGRVAKAARRGKSAQDPTPAIAPAGGPAFPKPKRETTPRTNIRARNPARAKKRLELNFGWLAELVRGLHCCVEGCQRRPSDPAHVFGRGAGGHAWIIVDGVETGNIAPLCRHHHNEAGRRGAETFDRETSFVVRLPATVVASVRRENEGAAPTLEEVAARVGRWAKAGGQIEAVPC